MIDAETIELLKEIPNKVLYLLLADATANSPALERLFYALSVALILWGISRIAQIRLIFDFSRNNGGKRS